MNGKVTRSYGILLTLWALHLLLCGVFFVGCDKLEPEKSACDGLVYKEFGLTREEYLPCVGEMIAKLEEMTPLLKATLEGDRKARAKAVKASRELQALINAAGGYQNLLGGWEDQSLAKLNIEVFNTYGHYDAFLTSTMMGLGSPAAGPEFERGQEALERAKRLYGALR